MNYIPIGCPLYQDILQLSDVLHHKDILQSSSFCPETSLILLTCYFNNIPQHTPADQVCSIQFTFMIFLRYVWKSLPTSGFVM